MDETVMEIQAIRKEKMRAVKKASFLFLIVISGCVTMRFPDTIKGTFFITGDTISNSSFSYQFKDTTFETTSSGDLSGYQDKAGGRYGMAGDTLILNYEPLEDPDPSLYKFLKREPLSATTNANSASREGSNGTVRFQIMNKMDEPVGGVALALRNEAEEILDAFSSDALGNYRELTIPKKKDLHDFRFNYIGSKSVTIPADTLRGHHSKVEIILSDSATSYSNYDGIKKYLIKEAEKNRIVLQRLENNEHIVLVRKTIILLASGLPT